MNIQTFLTGLGFDPEETIIYKCLAEKGQLTVVQIAQETDINRSKIYRRLENLQKLQLVDEVLDQHTTRYQISDIIHLDLLLTQQEQTTKQLRTNFLDIKSSILGQVGLHDPSTQVKFYRGKQGIRQMVWNILKTKKEVVGYTAHKIGEYIGTDFMQRWSDEFVHRNIYMRDLYSDQYLKSINNQDIIENSYLNKQQHSTSYYIPSTLLAIDFQTDIYNDTVAFYNYHKGEIFGVEIINPKIAKFQKQLFEIIWKLAEKENK